MFAPVVHLMWVGRIGCVLGLLETFAVWLRGGSEGRGRGRLGWRARDVPFGGCVWPGPRCLEWEWEWETIGG